MATTEHSGRSRRVGPVVTISTVVAVLAAACLTLFGLGAFDRAVAVYEPTNWLFSEAKGELGRVNGSTAKVDTRVKVAGTANHHIEVSQSDRYLVVRDNDTGVVSALDLTTLQIAASMDTTPGVGIRVVVHGNDAFVIDSVHGEVRQIDPLTLSPIGSPVSFGPGLVGGDFDGSGQLWVALPSQGTVAALTPGDKPTVAPAVHTRPVAEPSHDLAVSVLDKGVAVLDQTAAQLITVRGDKVSRTPLALHDLAVVAPRTSGERVPVTIPDSRQIEAVADPAVTTLPVPGDGDGLSPAVAWAGWFYIADNRAGVVYVLNDQGSLVDQLRFTGSTSDIELQVKDDYLYVNAVDGDTAQVVDKQHKVSKVNKYPNNVPGGDPPPPPPPPPTPPIPPVGPPLAPSNVVAAAGNASVHLTWGTAPANGSPVLKYVVDTSDGKTIEVGADQRALDIPGLINGTTYTFAVHAVNAKGAGPKRTSNPVIPTSDVPDPPASVTAQENKDGTVSVNWPAANGQGHKISGYQVTAVGPTGPVKTYQVNGPATTLSTPALPDLKYGTQYAFSVVTVNDKGAGSKESPLSNSVVPYTVPGAPGNLRATTGTTAGVVSVAWAAPASNGRPITKYTVTYGGTSVDVTSGTQVNLTGLADGQAVTVTVIAVNAAGDSAKAGPVTAKAIAKPTVTLGNASSLQNSITVPFTVNDGGGSATCTLSATLFGKSAGSAVGACTGLTIGGLGPNETYSYTVTVANQAGSATASGSVDTGTLNGVVHCAGTPTATVNCNSGNGVGIYTQPWQDTSSFTRWNGHSGTSYPAYCKAVGMKGNQQTSATLSAAYFNGYKTSDMWIRISALNAGPAYIPWIWFNMSPDDLSLLPTC